MNELSKLLSSLILLGAGFFAASFVGPPEVVGRLARLLQPTPALPADALRPAPATGVAMSGDGWPALAAPTAAPPSMATTDAHPSPAAGDASDSPWGSVAPVAAMVAPSSWPETAAAPTPSPFETTRAFAPPESAAVNDDWLTGAALAAPAPPTPQPRRGLSPVPRGGGSQAVSPIAAAPPAVEQPATPQLQAAWPELRGPVTPEPQPSQQLATPSLDESPYASRPRLEATASAADDRNPLRTGDSRTALRPLERQPIATTYLQHVVTDGDTLALLAERYLGDAGRIRELYELNRDRLESPDLLPIGMVLRAPDVPRSVPPTTVGEAFPTLPSASDFATVSATEDYGLFGGPAPRGPLTPIGANDEPPLTRAQQLGPVDALYDREVSWDANRW